MVDLMHDPWIANLLLSRWLIFVSTKLGDLMWVCDLFQSKGRGWSVELVIRLFGDQWHKGGWPRQFLFRGETARRLKTAWIWRLEIHPRVSLFVLKIT